MTSDPPDLSTRERTLDEVLAEYLRAVDAGQQPNRGDLAARYPELEAYLAEQDKMEQWMGPLRSVSQAANLGDTFSTFHSAKALEESVTDSAGPRPVTLSLDDYELLEPIARGGMGVVYKAKDRRLNRLVALKMLLTESGLTPNEAQRFRNEAEAVALLDHPNIVPIYAVGEQGGQPYLSMKLLEGGSLADQPSRFAASPREAARLLVPIARAVHYAHQRGILHRDLKPGNVLLDREGQPHVTDFGLAKRVGAAARDLTQSGAIVGTPPYMAPEQTAGRKAAVTTAADVYGLGAILYALLTGRPPFEGETVLETLEQVCTQTPEPPRKSNPAVDRDLELICLKCLEKEPPRRYTSAEALADELQRYLDGKPLALTRPVGTAERLWRWCRRKPVPAALLTTIALLLASVATVYTVGYFQLKAANRLEHASRVRAEENLQVALAAVAYFTRVSEDPRLRTRGLEQLRGDMWRSARDFYAQLARHQVDDPRLEAERARAFLQLGHILALLGSPGEALDSHRQAQEIFTRLSREHPGVPEYEDGYAQALLEQGTLHQLAKNYSVAQDVLDEALPIRQRLAEEHPDVPDYQQGLARTYHQLARLYQVTDKTPQARTTYETALRTFEQMTREHPEQPLLRELRARTHLSLGTAYTNARHTSVTQQVEHFAEANKNYAAARDVLTQLDREHPGDPTYRSLLAEAHHLLGSLRRRQGKPDQALPDYKESLDILERLVHDHPDVPEYQFLLGSVLHARGLAYLRLGRLDQARAEYDKAAEVKVRLAREYEATPRSGDPVTLPYFYQEEVGRLSFDRACLDALSLAAVQKDAKLQPAEREKRIEQYAQDAVEQLRKSWAAWLRDTHDLDPIKLLQEDPELHSLRKREDFAKMMDSFKEELRRRKKVDTP
jgi:tetratricopeptide (TPR) repeat protein